MGAFSINKIIQNKMIQTILTYIPFSAGGRKHNDSKFISEFKLGKKPALEKGFWLLYETLKNWEVPDKAILCSVPSSSGYENSITKVSRELATSLNITDGTNFIKKRYGTQRFCQSNRNTDELIRSLNFDERVNGKHIILLDDITTTGSTFKSISIKLYQMGALSVRCLAISQTLKLYTKS